MPLQGPPKECDDARREAARGRSTDGKCTGGAYISLAVKRWLEGRYTVVSEPGSACGGWPHCATNATSVDRVPLLQVSPMQWVSEGEGGDIFRGESARGRRLSTR